MNVLIKVLVMSALISVEFIPRSRNVRIKIFSVVVLPILYSHQRCVKTTVPLHFIKQYWQVAILIDVHLKNFKASLCSGSYAHKIARFNVKV